MKGSIKKMKYQDYQILNPFIYEFFLYVFITEPLGKLTFDRPNKIPFTRNVRHLFNLEFNRMS